MPTPAPGPRRLPPFVRRLRSYVYDKVEWGVAGPHLEREIRTFRVARQLAATIDSAAYAAARMGTATAFSSKRAVLECALEHALAHAPAGGLYLEFGVWEGSTIRLIAGRAPGEVHGFDSFEGLPEDWLGEWNKGAFHMHGALPTVPGNVRLHKGWFDATLPDFAATHAGPVTFLHVDCDLYSSTQTVFAHLGDRLVPGSVVLFDEYFNYPGWRDHEYRAFQELVAARGLRYRYLCYNDSEFNAAVVIEAVGAAPAP